MATYDALAAAYRPNERKGAIDSDANKTTRIEVQFALPAYITPEQERRLFDLVDEITRAPHNQPVGGVHWPSFVGCQPSWSEHDAAMLQQLGTGLPGKVDPALQAGDEPTGNAEVLCVATSARAYVTTAERDRHEHKGERHGG